MLTYKILGLLLTYPSGALQQNMEELKTVIHDEGLLPKKLEGALHKFMDSLARRDLLNAQEDYCGLFDRGRGHSLHLFEHVHGESRDRGQAMINLIDHYKEKGLHLADNELPDYLPLFMEFLSLCAPKEAQEELGDIVHIVAAIAAKLKAKKSDYHLVFKAIEKLTDAKIDEDFVKQALAEEEARDDSLEALDKEWEDAPAFGDLAEADCNTCPSATPHTQQQAQNLTQNLAKH